jgi:excinuclease ABC subunit C
LAEPPQRIECFDISHTSGEATIASCVVFDQDGARKSDYRRFNIRDVAAGDDYAAMEQALQRRYTRVKRDDGVLPELLLVDGGKGQLGRALAVLEELQINDITVVGVAKGTTRKAGLETLIVHDGRHEKVLPRDSAALLLIQQIRDEAHRFAITAHRQARAKNRSRSPLDRISGVGAKRRAQLIRHFGGWQGVARAGVDDLCRVQGISRTLAQKIYDEMHGGI